MAKELPYFRFTAQEWQNGDISLESYELKGFFMDLCAYYWLKDCSTTKAMLEKRFRDAKELIEELIELEIITHDNKTDFVCVSYLNEQFDVLSEKRKRRQDAGRKGGKQKSSNAKAMPKQKYSYKDKDKDKDNHEAKELLDYSKSFFDEKYLTDTTLETFDKLLRIDKYTSLQIKNAIVNGNRDEFWSKQFQSPNKLRNKNKDEVKYIDVFLALKDSKDQFREELNKMHREGSEKEKYLISQIGNSLLKTNHIKNTKFNATYKELLDVCTFIWNYSSSPNALDSMFRQFDKDTYTTLKSVLFDIKKYMTN